MSKITDILTRHHLLKGPGALRDSLEERRTRKVAKRRLCAAARQHRFSKYNTVINTQIPLPMIDAHCHLFGQNLTGTGPGLDIITGMADSISSDARMGYYGMRPDRQNADLMLKHLRKFRTKYVDGRPASACVALQLDFAYTPLAAPLPSHTPNAVLPGDFKFCSEADIAATNMPDPSRYYPDKGRYLWLNRSPEIYEKQLETFGAVSALYCGEIWPLVPFDPRRPNGLDFVKKAIEQLGWVGVKLYSRCGWLPYENAKMHGKGPGGVLDRRLDDLYTYCTTHDIPLLVHTSPTGFPPPGLLALPKDFYVSLYVRKASQLYRVPGDTVGAPPELIDPNAKPKTGKAFAEQAMTYMCNYCRYVQLSTSPYSWEPVLQRYPKLRLDLAHSGGTLGVYGKYAMGPDQASKWVDETEENPFVLGNTSGNGHQFEDYLRRGVRKLAFKNLEAYLDPPKKWSEMSKTRAAFQTLLTVGTAGLPEFYRQDKIASADRDRRDAIAEIDRTLNAIFDANSEWGRWLTNWKAAYPVDWTTKISELVSVYDNVYTDIAYISGDATADFKKILDNLLTGASDAVLKSPKRATDGWAAQVCTSHGAAMAYKNMFATDWFMTAMSKLEPFDFWKRIQNSVDPSQQPKLWALLATDNALRWLNLGGRFNGKGMEMLEDYYTKMWKPDPPPLPGWWNHLKKFYETDSWSKLRYGRPLPPIPSKPSPEQWAAQRKRPLPARPTPPKPSPEQRAAQRKRPLPPTPIRSRPSPEQRAAQRKRPLPPPPEH